MRRMIVAGVAALVSVAAAGFYLTDQSGRAADAPFRVTPVDRGSITASVRATGTMSAVTTVLVGSQLSGQVVEILADFNSPVKAGQVVARLNAEQIGTRRDAARADLAQARADLLMREAQSRRARATRERAQATLKDQEAQVARATAQAEDARRTLDRQTALTARDVGSQTALDTARTQTEVLAAALDSARAQLAGATAELTGLDADIAIADAQVKSAEALVAQREAKLRDIEIDLGRADIRSPVDGVVVQRQIDLGQTVAASLQAPTLFTIAQDLRRIDIYANVDEADVGRVKEGQPVSFSVNAYPARTFSGRVRMVRLAAQTVQNVVTYTAVIGVENTDHALLPGMTANLEIITDERVDVLRVPNAALRFRLGGTAAAASASSGDAQPQRPNGRGRGEGRRMAGERAGERPGGMPGRVFVLGPDAQPNAVAVRIGATDGAFTEVLSGELKDGDGVIVGGGPKLTAEAPAATRRPPRMF